MLDVILKLLILIVLAVLWLTTQFHSMRKDGQVPQSKAGFPFRSAAAPALSLQQELLSVKDEGVNTDSTTPEASTPRLLFMTASYTLNQILYLQKAVDCMRDICNAGWNVTVLIQASSELTLEHPKYLEIVQQSYCQRIQSPLKIELQLFKKIGFGLNAKHRAYALEHLHDFDYFSYAEEDMLLTLSHLNAHIAASELIKKQMPTTWMRYSVGFLRYEDSVDGDERLSWEYVNHQIHVVDLGASLGKYIVTNNLNQAINIFPREQLIDLEERCAYLTDPGQNEFYRELRRAMNKEWKYMAVGVSCCWTDQAYMMHHSSNIAQKRRTKKDKLSMTDWLRITEEKSLTPISLDKTYSEIIRRQYNLHLMDYRMLSQKGVKWSNFEDFE